jgi:cytochrome b pre-mRNA-processing protein 3
MLFARFRDRRRRATIARDLYDSLVAQARAPHFYTALGVADTLDGRYDMIVAHAFLLMRRLGAAEAALADQAKNASQAIFDLLFADMECNLREIGVSDITVGTKVKKMVQAFYGRVAAYDVALPLGVDALALAVARNLYREDPPTQHEPAAVAAYMVRQAAHLAEQSIATILLGKIEWMPPEETL